MWAPDVYEGAPTPVTAYLAVASKAVAFALMLRLFAAALAPAIDDWRNVLAAMAVLSMVIGNLVAIVQTNIKRMLAYSSIGQAGYLLMGIAALSTEASNGLIFHLVGYSATNFAAFTAIIAYQNLTGRVSIDGYAGLGKRQPFLALAISGAFFSLAGLPIFSGFATKFYLFTAVAQEGMLWLVIIAATASLVSLYYYLMVIKRMYLERPRRPRAPAPRPAPAWRPARPARRRRPLRRLPRPPHPPHRTRHRRPPLVGRTTKPPPLWGPLRNPRRRQGAVHVGATLVVAQGCGRGLLPSPVGAIREPPVPSGLSPLETFGQPATPAGDRPRRGNPRGCPGVRAGSPPLPCRGDSRSPVPSGLSPSGGDLREGARRQARERSEGAAPHQPG